MIKSTRAFAIVALSCTLLVLPVVQAHAQNAGTVKNPSYCPAKSKWTNGVYHPSRLVLQGAVCQRAVGTVRSVRHEEDGDLHIGVKLISEYNALINDVNLSKQHGWLVVEFMPRDGGHLPEPSVGDKVTLVGAWILDTQHGWMELHPVWREVVHGETFTSGPQFGGSPAGDKSSNAAEDCVTNKETACIGY